MWLALLLFSLPLTAAEEDQPSQELLEYLGSWEGDTNYWFDPQMLELAALDGAETNDETANEQDDN